MAISGVSNQVSRVPSVDSPPALRSAPQTIPSAKTSEKDSDKSVDQYEASLLGHQTQEDNLLVESPAAAVIEPAQSEKDDKAETEEPSHQASAEKLTPNDLRVIADLQLRDREVRAHEAAHKAVGGGHVGGASYTYQQGPDGRQYAIGGEVSVNMSSAGSNPEAIIAKMNQIRAAALAPADPSSQDHAVAAAASAITEQARETIRNQERNERAEAAVKEQAAKEQTAKEQARSDTEESQNITESDLDLLGSADPKTVNALAAYEASMQRPYLSGLNLVG